VREAKAGAFAYGARGKGWSLRLRVGEAKAGAFAYGAGQRLEPSLTVRGQRLEPSLTVRGKGWSLRLRTPLNPLRGKGRSLRLQFFGVAGARFAVFDVS